ncbi:transposase, partial [bacterium]|nr:transposase [bacterium]
LLPERTRSSRGGRPPADDRRCFEGILWVLKSGARWKDLPREFPSPATPLRDCFPSFRYRIVCFFHTFAIVPTLVQEKWNGSNRRFHLHGICTESRATDPFWCP